MKKTRRITLLALIAVLALAVVAMVACQDTSAKITFDGNGATGGTAPQAIDTTIGATVTLPQCNLTKTGHTFDGWKTGDKTYNAGDTFEVTAAETTFVAQWKAEQPVEPTTYALTYAAGDHGTGTAPAAVQKEAGAKFNLAAATTFTAETGFEFDGWSDGTNTYAAGAEFTMPAKAVTLTAQWKAEQPVEPTTYALTYAVGDHGTGTAPAAVQKEAGAKFNLAAATTFTAETGFEFDGWSDGTTKYAAGAEFTMPAKAVTLTAQWKAVQYTVTFDPNNDGATWTVKVNHGATVARPAEDPTIESGKTFRYWANGGEYDFATPVTADLELTAEYAWKITFLAGEGATGTVEPQWVKMWRPNAITLPQATGLSNGSKVFAGWNDGTMTYDAGDLYGTSGLQNVTFTAQWNDSQPVDPNKFTLTFTVGGHGAGTPPATRQLSAGETTVLPDGTGLVLDEGFENEVFLGWSESWRGEPLLLAGSIYTMPAKNVTLQAIWGEQAAQPDPDQKYPVTWLKSSNESQSGSITGNLPAELELAAGETITMPAADTLTFAHYTLTKWRVQTYTTDGYWETITNVNPGEAYAMPSKAIRIVAVWTANKVTISFDANGGSGTMNSLQKDFGYGLALTTATFDCKFTAPVGKEFEGWSFSANGAIVPNGTKLDATVVSAEDTVTLYAIWQTAAVIPTTPLIDDIKGSWTATGHTLDILAISDSSNEYIKGYAVLDGKFLLEIMDDSGIYYAYSKDFELFYAVSLSAENLSLTPDSGSAIVLSGKTELVNLERTVFQGKWNKEVKNAAGTVTGYQPWIITESDVYYGIGLTKAAIGLVIGNNFAICYTGANEYNYTYLVEKSENNLVGWYDVSEKSPEAATFVPADFLTLTVDGELNQIVNSGSAPDANKIKTPTAPDGQTFSKWVLAGTETEFDLTAAMTADVSIVAVFETGASDSSKTYIGNCLVTVGSGILAQQYTVSKFEIDFAALTGKAVIDNAESNITLQLLTSMPTELEAVYGANSTYYEISIKYGQMSTQNYIIVNPDQSKFTLCDSNDKPYGTGEFVSQTGEIVEKSERVELADIDGKVFVAESAFYSTTSFGSTTNYTAAKVTFDSNFNSYKIVLLADANKTTGKSYTFPSGKEQIAGTEFTMESGSFTIQFGFMKDQNDNYQLILISLHKADEVELLTGAPVTLTLQSA